MPWWRRPISVLVIVTTVAALASFAAASASASNLCEVAPNGNNECPAGNEYGEGQEFELSSVNAEINVEGPLVKCKESKLTFKVTAIEAEFAVQGELQQFTFSKCEAGTAKCTMTAMPNKVRIRQNGGGNGEFLVEPKGEFQITCGVLMCNFNSKAETLGTLTGGNPANLTFAQALETKQELCEGAKFNAKYTTVKPEPLWVTKF